MKRVRPIVLGEGSLDTAGDIEGEYRLYYLADLVIKQKDPMNKQPDLWDLVNKEVEIVYGADRETF